MGTLDLSCGRQRGRIERLKLDPAACGRRQSLHVYLPPSYDLEPARRYPVLYMHFGNELFEPNRAGGECWHLHPLIERLLGAGLIEEFIVVGIDTMERTVAADLNHYRNLNDHGPMVGDCLGGLAYEAFILNYLMPYIAGRFRTRPGPDHTAMVGACAGATATYNIAERNPGVFGKIGLLSPAVLSVAQRDWLLAPPGHRPQATTWIYVGGLEGGEYLEPTRQLVDDLITWGAQPGADLFFLQEPLAPHRTASWAECMAHPLLLFFGRVGQPVKTEFHGADMLAADGKPLILNPVVEYDSGFRATPLDADYQVSDPALLRAEPNGHLHGLAEGSAAVVFRFAGFEEKHAVRVVKQLPETVSLTLRAKVIEDQPTIKAINFGYLILKRSSGGHYEGVYQLPRGYAVGENFSCWIGQFELDRDGNPAPLRVLRAERDEELHYTIERWPPLGIA